MTIADLRAQTISNLGYTNFIGLTKSYADLDAQEQINVTNAMMAYIVANSSDFTSDQAAQARAYLNTGIQNVPLQDTSFASEVGDFTNEVGNQVVSLNEALNPFSETNRKYVLGFLVVGAVLYCAIKYAPQLKSAFKK